MPSLIRRHLWFIALPLYWLLALGLLFDASPISWDGSGQDATFYWGRRPHSPTLAEWNANPELRLQFYVPYFVVACFVTLVGVGLATFLSRRRNWAPQAISCYV